MPTDSFGFEIPTKNDETITHVNHKSTQTIEKIVAWLIIILFSILILCSIVISAVLAWQSIDDNNIYLRLFKTYLAIVFFPIYLFYYFIKTFIAPVSKK